MPTLLPAAAIEAPVSWPSAPLKSSDAPLDASFLNDVTFLAVNFLPIFALEVKLAFASALFAVAELIQFAPASLRCAAN